MGCVLIARVEFAYHYNILYQNTHLSTPRAAEIIDLARRVAFALPHSYFIVAKVIFELSLFPTVDYILAWGKRNIRLPIRIS